MAINTAILQNFLINGTVLITFLILGILIIKRKRNRLTWTLASFFFLTAIGIVFNITYRLLDDYNANLILNPLVVYFSCISLVSLFSFNQILLKSEQVFDSKKEIMIYVIVFIILLLSMFIPNGVEWQYVINIKDDTALGLAAFQNRYEGDIGVPVWDPLFGIFFIVISQIIMAMIINSTVQLNKKMGDPAFRKKYIMSVIGMLLNDIVLLGNFISNTLNDPGIRSALLMVSLVIFPAAFLMFYGLGSSKNK